MVLGGAQGAPGNALHHEFLECENGETQTSAKSVSKGG